MKPDATIIFVNHQFSVASGLCSPRQLNRCRNEFSSVGALSPTALKFQTDDLNCRRPQGTTLHVLTI